MRLEDSDLIGNCQFSALIHKNGEIVWCYRKRKTLRPSLHLMAGICLHPAAGAIIAFDQPE
jgi:hypothetical protein